MTNTETAKRLLDELKENGGYTYDPRMDVVVKNGHGYVVAAPYHEQKVAFEDIDHHTIRLYMSEHKNDVPPSNGYYGAWLDETDMVVYLDVCIIYQNRNVAISNAKAFGQLAIYDLENEETIGV